jgi:hypothetical protein
MKRLCLVFLLMVAPLWMLTACGQEQDKQVTAEQAKEEVEEAAEAVVALTQQEMDSFVDMMEGQLALFDERVTELEKRAEGLAGDAKQTMAEKIDTIKEKRQQAMDELERLKSTSADAWDELKMGVQASFFELKQAADAAAAEL